MCLQTTKKKLPHLFTREDYDEIKKGKKELKNSPGPAAFPPMAVMTWLKNVAMVCFQKAEKYRVSTCIDIIGNRKCLYHAPYHLFANIVYNR